MRRLFYSFILLSGLFIGWQSAAGAAAAHTVTFFSNGSSGANQSAYESSIGSADLTPFAQLKPSFVNSGYVFNNWNTRANGTGTTFTNGSKYSFNSDLSLYAQWTQEFNSVEFFENRAAGDPVTSVETKDSPSVITDEALLIPQFLNPGFQFIGWNTKANGLGTNYKNDAVYSFASDLTLYAQWKKAPSQSHALRLIGVVTTGNEGPQVRSISRVISHEHLKSLDIVQCGTSAPNGKALASSLAQKMVEGNGGAVSIGYRLPPQSPVAETEVFALVTVPSPTV